MPFAYQPSRTRSSHVHPALRGMTPPQSTNFSLRDLPNRGPRNYGSGLQRSTNRPPRRLVKRPPGSRSMAIDSSTTSTSPAPCPLPQENEAPVFTLYKQACTLHACALSLPDHTSTSSKYYSNLRSVQTEYRKLLTEMEVLGVEDYVLDCLVMKIDAILSREVGGEGIDTVDRGFHVFRDSGRILMRTTFDVREGGLESQATGQVESGVNGGNLDSRLVGFSYDQMPVWDSKALPLEMPRKGSRTSLRSIVKKVVSKLRYKSKSLTNAAEVHTANEPRHDSGVFLNDSIDMPPDQDIPVAQDEEGADSADGIRVVEKAVGVMA